MRSIAVCLRLLAFWSCLVVGANTFAAGANPPRWSIDGGRVFQHAITSALGAGMSLAEDGAGFVWIGTQGGLVRWDGYRDHHYAADPALDSALPDSYVRKLHVDTQGRLWIGTSAGGLARYEPLTDSFVRIADPERLIGAEVTAITADGDAGLWIGGMRGMARLDPANGRLRREPLPAAIGAVKALLRARDGTLWLGSEHGLWRRTAGATGFTDIPLPTADGRAPTVTRLLEDQAGNLWAGTRLRGAYVVAPGAAQGRPVDENGADDLASDTVHDIAEARPGEVWIGTYGNGILRVDTASGLVQRERHDPTRPSSIVDDSVGALLRTRNGLVWVATNYALSRYDPHQDTVDTLYGGPGRPIRHASVPAVLALPDGRVWLGTGEAGVEILDASRGPLAQLRPDPRRPATTLPKARVITLARGSDGAVWIGSQAGLYRALADGSGLARIEIPGRRPTAEVWALHVDGSRLWLGGQEGLWELDASTPAAPRTLRHIAGELANRHVTALAAGRDGALWVGTASALARLDRTSGRIDNLLNDPRDPQALPGGMVAGLLTDRRGRLWVATFGRGVQVEDGRRADGSLRFRRLTTKDGLPHDGTNAILEDQQGHVWVSTDDGLARIDSATLEVRSLGAAQGVGIQAYWTGSASAMAGGELLFGGQGGLTVVRPERLRPQGAPPPMPVVTEAHVGGRSVAPARLTSAITTVPANPRSLLVEFASLAYAEPQSVRYAYRLVGFDAGWIETSAQRRLASYTNLPHGNYTLQLRAAPARGDWTEALALPLHVQPVWHEYAAVRVAAGALALAALVGLVHLRTLVLRQRQRRLEALVAERTAALEQRTDELHRSQRQLEQLAYFDPLTGLANRRLFNEELRRLVAQVQRGSGPFALVLVDLDRFKQINDELGHDVGDKMLVAAAQRLREVVRDSDRVARLGGDEFALLLRPSGDCEALDVVCRRIVDRLGEPLLLPAGPTLRCGASVGVALCPQDATSADAIFKAADVALYDAKRAGRGTWRKWQSGRTVPVALA